MVFRRGVPVVVVALAFLVAPSAFAQFNSGSDGHDGAFNPTANIEIDMADHPDGIYQYASVNIPQGVTVSFKPNVANTPVVWLVQGDCTIAGTVSVDGSLRNGLLGGKGGPGGYRGGNGPVQGALPEAGLGPGGGTVLATEQRIGGHGSYGTAGATEIPYGSQYPPGSVYGNDWLLPLLGGSGGSGGYGNYGHGYDGGGHGGGGAILIAASGYLHLGGSVAANGGGGSDSWSGGGAGGGSGGAIRLVASSIDGNGTLSAQGGWAISYWGGGIYASQAGAGRIRIEGLVDNFGGRCYGVLTRGAQMVLILPVVIQPQLEVSTIAGLSVPAAPTGLGTSPDIKLPGETQNPVEVVVECKNMPLNTIITVEAKPYHGASVAATAQNTNGTDVSSMATVSLDIPRGGGTITAKAVTAVNPGKSGDGQPQNLSYQDSGLTSDGERFKTAEVSTTLGGKSELVYVTESGKRFPVKSQE